MKINTFILGCFLCVVAFGGTASIKTSYNKMEISSFEAKAKTCATAKNYALEDCNYWAKILQNGKENFVPSCRADLCYRATDGKHCQAVCLGTATHKIIIGITSENGVKSGMRKGEKVNEPPSTTSYGYGLTCYDATYEALRGLYLELEIMSTQYDVISLLPRKCSCNRGNGKSDFTAECSGGVNAIHRAAELVD